MMLLLCLIGLVMGRLLRLGIDLAGVFACAALWWLFLSLWPFLAFLVVCLRCPCAGRHLLFFATAKKSRQKKAGSHRQLVGVPHSA